MRTSCLLGVTLLLSSGLSAHGLNNSAALTPPMAWSSWNAFHCNINGSQLLDVADALVSSGMLAAGYKSINIDDCWPLRQRNAAGEIVPNPAKFPDGMGAFSSQLKQKGVGLGIYTAHGNLTCQKFPGSWGHEEQDAQTYKKWGVVFVKNDWCWHHEEDESKHLAAFNAMRDALGKTGVPMVHSIHWNYADTPGPGCQRGVDCPLPATANMWRVGGDIGPNWASVLRLLDINANQSAAAGPGSWNDMDMLEVGNGMTDAQDQAHFSIWCIMASPLIAGNDLRKMSAGTIAILTNKHAISVNQDSLGIQAHLVAQTDYLESASDIRPPKKPRPATQVWVKELAPVGGKGAVAVLLLNRISNATTIELPISKTYEVFDLWAGAKSLGVKNGTISAHVEGTACAFYRLEEQ